MSGINTVTLVGNVGQEPDVRTTNNGTKVAKLSLATSRKFNGTEKTEWHRLTVFGKTADVVEQWVHKGDKIGVTGRIEYSTTDHDGTTRYWTDIVVNDLTMLGSKSKPEPHIREDVTSDSGLPF